MIREVDLAFRRGGEEFVVLLPETDALGGTIVAERLNTAVRDAPIVVPPKLPAARGEPTARGIPVTVSIGVAVYPEHGATGLAVLEVADDALYGAKAAGRDTYRLASPEEPRARAGGASAKSSARGGAPAGPHPALPGAGR